MKPILFLLTACASFGATATATLDFTSRYTFRGAALGGQSLQPSVSIEHGATTATIWANRPVAKEASSEIDFSVTREIGGFDLGLTAYTYPGSAKTTWEPSLGISHDIGDDFKVSLTVFRDLALRATTLESKLALAVLKTKRTEAGFDLAAGGTRDYTYWSAGCSAKHTISNRLSVLAGAQYTSSNDRTIERDILSWRVGAVWGF